MKLVSCICFEFHKTKKIPWIRLGVKEISDKRKKIVTHHHDDGLSIFTKASTRQQEDIFSSKVKICSPVSTKGKDNITKTILIAIITDNIIIIPIPIIIILTVTIWIASMKIKPRNGDIRWGQVSLMQLCPCKQNYSGQRNAQDP